MNEPLKLLLTLPRAASGEAPVAHACLRSEHGF
jgi:hypothetical protein